MQDSAPIHDPSGWLRRHAERLTAAGVDVVVYEHVAGVTGALALKHTLHEWGGEPAHLVQVLTVPVTEAGMLVDALDPATGTARLVRIARHAEDSDCLIALSSREPLDWRVMAVVARRPDRGSWAGPGIASRPDIPPRVARLLARRPKELPNSGWGDMIEILVQNPAVPADVIRSAVEFDWVLSCAAANPCCPEDILRRAVGGPPGAVQNVAGNPGCPPDLLDRLATHRDPRVREAVAGNPSAPIEVASAAALA